MERESISNMTLKSRAIEYCSDEELLAKELSHLLQVFVDNGYPANTVWRLLYQDNKARKKETELEISKALYAPYHPRARRFFNILKKEFGFDVIYKKTKTLGDIILKKGRQIEKGHRRNVVYSTLCNVLKEICRTDNCNAQQTEQPTQKLVPKEIQEANTKINKEK